MRALTLLTAFAGSVLILTTGQAQEQRVERGRTLAEARCTPCHAIGLSGTSPLAAAPPFRSLRLDRPLEDLTEVFSKAHEKMPQFQELDGSQVADLAMYLRSLQR